MNKTKQLVQALVLGGILGVSATANAALMTSQSYTFNGSASATDSEGIPNTSSNNNATLGSASITQFNANTGVLTGVTLNLTGNQIQSTTVSAQNGPNNVRSETVTTSGSGTSSVQVSAPGISHTFSGLTQTDTCTGINTGACSGVGTTTSQSTTLFNASATASNLDSYVGSSTVNIGFKAPTLSASQSKDVFTGTESTVSKVTWSGSGSVVYDYLLHANGSFNGSTDKNILSLDFGTVFQGDTDPALSFSIFNLASLNRTGLDLDSISGSGNTSALTTSFSASSNVLQGASKDFSAFLDTANLGTFNAVYTFNLSDANIGASSTWQNSTLTLNLTGKVVAVPEPLSIALLGAGLLGIAASRRRKS